MKTRLTKALALVFALALVAAACSDDSSDSNASDSTTTTTTAAGGAGTSDSSVAGEMTIAEIAASNEDFSTLVTALDAAGLVDTLNGDGEFTVFAPTNAAFEALPAGALDQLLADPEGALTNVLTYHVYGDGAVLAADVVSLDGQQITMLNGDTVTVNVDDAGSVTLTDASGNTATVVQTDIEASNGVIHVIDGVLLPPQ